jgi:hypothetical protein
MIDKSKIAIITTVANFDLYNKTSLFFPVGIRKYVIDGTKGKVCMAYIVFYI